MLKTIRHIPEVQRKEETGYVRRALRRIKETANCAAITASILLISTKSEAYGPQPNESIKEAGNDKDQNLASLRMKSANGVETLSVDKTCLSTSFERMSTSDILTINFEGGSRLKVELEKGAVQRVLIRNPYLNSDAEASVNDLEGILKGSHIAGVSSPPVPGAKRFTTYDLMPRAEELIFKRGDGVEVVLELRPGAIRSIEYFKG